MLFKDYHIPMIRSESKTVTRREWADNYPGPNVGTVVAAKTELLKPDNECDCFIRITDKREEYLGEITEASARREGDYDGVEDFREGYEKVYGAGAWDANKVVTVVEFEYVGEKRPGDNSEQTEIVTDGGQCADDTDRFEELEDEQYGYYNDVPHALIDLNYQEWSEVVKQVLEYTLGPPVAYYYEGGTLHLWGEQLDESLLLEIADGCKDLEREFADDGFYDAAKSARRASSRVSRGVVHPAGEVTIT